MTTKLGTVFLKIQCKGTGQWVLVFETQVAVKYPSPSDLYGIVCHHIANELQLLVNASPEPIGT